MRFKQFTPSRLGRFVALATVAAAVAVAITGQAIAAASPSPPDLIERWVANHKAQALAPQERRRAIDRPVAHVYQRLQNRPAARVSTLGTLIARLEATAQMYACDSGTTQYPSDVLGHCEYVPPSSPSSSWNEDAP
ncbi:MAG TPA: hypothetical protein VIZ44_03060 [Gaiellaceae bacterium]